MSESQKRSLYSTAETMPLPRNCCTPKIQIKDNLLCPIKDYTGSVIYSISKALAEILSPLVEKTIHQAENSLGLVKKLQSVQISESETLVSFEVVALLTNIPLDKAI